MKMWIKRYFERARLNTEYRKTQSEAPPDDKTENVNKQTLYHIPAFLKVIIKN